MNVANKQKSLQTLWKRLAPWCYAITLLLVLRYTGILAGVSVFANRALMELGMMKATPAPVASDEYLDYNFKVTSMSGEEIDFSTFKGKRIFVNLWATWCGPCRAEMPSIQKLYETADKEKITFVMLSLDGHDKKKAVEKFINSKPYTFPVYMASDLPELLQVNSIPSTFVFDAKGKLIYQKTGMASYDSEKFRKFVEGTE